MIKAPPTTFWRRFRFIGPSLILTATLIGSGELIVTTTYGAQAGFKALWLIIAACFLKVAIQESLGRYTISSGDTSLVALDRLPGPRWGAGWAVWVWFICVILGAVQLGGIALTVGECLQVTWPGVSARWWPACVLSAGPFSTPAVIRWWKKCPWCWSASFRFPSLDRRSVYNGHASRFPGHRSWQDSPFNCRMPQILSREAVRWQSSPWWDSARQRLSTIPTGALKKGMHVSPVPMMARKNGYSEPGGEFVLCS